MRFCVNNVGHMFISHALALSGRYFTCGFSSFMLVALPDNELFFGFLPLEEQVNLLH